MTDEVMLEDNTDGLAFDLAEIAEAERKITESDEEAMYAAISSPVMGTPTHRTTEIEVHIHGFGSLFVDSSLQDLKSTILSKDKEEWVELTGRVWSWEETTMLIQVKSIVSAQTPLIPYKK